MQWTKEKRIRSWFMVIFGLPFFAVGLFFIFKTAVSLFDAVQMASWQQTQGALISAKLSHHRSDDSTTYKAEARYRYRVNGVEYSGERVAIHSGSDNIGDFQQQLGRQLEQLYRNQEPVPVYYNPSNPSEAVINRDIRWGMIGFSAIFIILFGGSGKNRSRSEEVKWQDSGYAQVEPAGRGMRLSFRFSVPEGLSPSEEETGNYYLWRLTIKAEQSGIDLDRAYTIPVYATAEKSRLQHLVSAKEAPRGMLELKAETLLPLRRNGMLQELYYPILRQPVSSIVFMVVGVVFAIAGVILWGKAQQEGLALYFMGGIFTIVGSMVALAGFYAAFNSLYIAWDGRQVVTIRRLLGITIHWKKAHYHELREIELKKGATTTQNGKAHKIDYHVIAQTTKGKIVLAENLDSHSKAKLVTDFFRKQFGLRE
jgi:hypothetical protein